MSPLIFLQTVVLALGDPKGEEIMLESSKVSK